MACPSTASRWVCGGGFITEEQNQTSFKRSSAIAGVFPQQCRRPQMLKVLSQRAEGPQIHKMRGFPQQSPGYPWCRACAWPSRLGHGAAAGAKTEQDLRGIRDVLPTALDVLPTLIPGQATRGAMCRESCPAGVCLHPGSRSSSRLGRCCSPPPRLLTLVPAPQSSVPCVREPASPIFLHQAEVPLLF